MKITYDPAKNAANIEKHGLSFDDVVHLDWNNAYTFVDDRHDYGETRISAYLPLNGRLYFVGYTERPEGRRIITFRKANIREVKAYAENH